MASHVDVIIIGSGQAGVPLATRLARAGKRVVLVERGPLGGTCVNYGCTPTKTMIASARAAHVARTAARLGVHCDEVSVDLSAVVDRKEAVVRAWRDSVDRKLAEAGDGLQLVRGHARFVGEREIEVAWARFRAETVVLNVGARAAVPRVPGLDDVPWLDSGRILDVRELPRHLLVLGGGYIGCELAQMFRRFGSEVTVIDAGGHLMGREDEAVSAAIEQVFAREGIGLELGAGVQRVSRRNGEIAVQLPKRELRGSHLLVATGRRPNTDDLGCEAARIELDPRGFVIADDRYRTTAPGVYAVGDAIGQPQFTHVAWDDHRLLFDIMMGRSDRSRTNRITPRVTFTDPQIAGVGLTEREARERGIAYDVASMPFADIARAHEVDETAGVLRVLIDPQSERILGGSIVGLEAGELIHVLLAAMQSGARARALVDAQFAHPTLAEGLQSLLMRLPRYAE